MPQLQIPSLQELPVVATTFIRLLPKDTRIIAFEAGMGVGKTTFIKLLCRLYDPTEGVIKLNGVDIRKYSYEEYQKIFSVVFQDFHMFPFALGENIAVAKEFDKRRYNRR